MGFPSLACSRRHCEAGTSGIQTTSPLFAAPFPLRRRVCYTVRVKEHARSCAQWPVFPAVIIGSIGTAILLMPRVGIVLAMLIAQTAALVVIALLEHVLPFRPEWNRPHRDV